MNIEGTAPPESCPRSSASTGGAGGPLAGGPKAPFISPKPSDIWEDWMMWDDPADDSVAHSPHEQSSSSMEGATSSSRKRKSTADDSPENHTVIATPGKKPTTSNRSHNVVERRYRTNLNAKIADLRDSVPSLKALALSTVQSPHNSDTSAPKLNKATILSTAVSYIHDLERDKKRLETEVSELRARLRSTKREDDEMDSISSKAEQAPSTAPISVPQGATPGSSTSSSWENPAQGMIQVPEDMRRLRTAAVPAQYAEQPYLAHDDDEHEVRSTIDIGESGARRARQIGKFMVGSFAGLMVVQGFGVREPDEGRHSKRSISDTTVESPWTQSFQVLVTHLPQITSHNLQYVLFAMKAILVLFVLGFGIFLYAFCSKPKRRKQGAAQRPISIPSLASPLEVRRNAWLTSVQTVRVPRHEMFPEWAAVNLEALHYVIRQAVGWSGYSWMTGQSEEDEIARVRAWDIAIDAQLMGGDAEISGSRLILTILASGTLPSTPARLMLKALHLRILLWKACKHGKGSLWSVVHKIAALLATQQWRLAQNLQRTPPQKYVQLLDEAESLPEHLTALLQLSCNEVLTGPIIQRAYNLAWSRPTQDDVPQTDSEMDLVVEDSTIRSPLDAMCAWLSSSTLHRALLASLANNEMKSTSESEWNFGVALHTAPRASIAQARALAANAVFVDANRQSALSMLSEDFPSTAITCSTQSTDKGSNPALFIDSSMPEAVGYDVTLATYCALAISKFEDASVAPAIIEEALEVVSLGYQNVQHFTWLSYAAAHRLVQALSRDNRNDHKQLKRLIAPMVPRLMNWIEGLDNFQHGFEAHDVCSPSADTCEAATRIGGLLVDLNDSDNSPSISHTTDQIPYTAPASYVQEATKEPVKDRKTDTVLSENDQRRHSRCSQDSGYGSR